MFDEAKTLRPDILLVSGPTQMELPLLPLETAPPVGLHNPTSLRIPRLWLTLSNSPLNTITRCVEEFLTTCAKGTDLF